MSSLFAYGLTVRRGPFSLQPRYGRHGPRTKRVLLLCVHENIPGSMAGVVD